MAELVGTPYQAKFFLERPARITWSPTMLVLSAAALVGPISGQTTTIHPSASCHSCSVVMSPEVVLGAVDGPGIIESMYSTAVRDSRGRYYVVGPYSSVIKVFAAQGEYLTTIGRRGTGPGEYHGIGSVVVGPKDSLFVFDQELRRFTVLTPDYEVARTVVLLLGPQQKTVRLGNGSFVTAVPIESPGLTGLPLHLLSPAGKRIRSFGAATGAYRADIPYLDSRSIAAEDSTHLWSAYLNQYEIQLIDVTTGATVRRLTRTVPWFASWLKPMASRFLPEKPQPSLFGIRRDSHGLLWVIIEVADPRWREVVTHPANQEEFGISDDQLYYDSVIEVIDPKTGDLLATRRFPEAISHFVADDAVGAVIEDASGVPMLHVWRLKLSHP